MLCIFSVRSEWYVKTGMVRPWQVTVINQSPGSGSSHVKLGKDAKMWQAREQTYPGMILSAAMYEREIEDPPAIKTNHKFSQVSTREII